MCQSLAHEAALPFTIFRVPTYIREGNPADRLRAAHGVHRPLLPRRRRPPRHGGPQVALLPRPAVTQLRGQLVRPDPRDAVPGGPGERVLHSERPALGTDDFVRILLLDGSFIL